MKFKEGDVVRLECDVESRPFVIHEIREDRYYNRNGFYIEENREEDFEVIGNSKDYYNFIWDSRRVTFCNIFHKRFL